MAKTHIDCATENCTNIITIFGRNRREADRKAAWAEDEGFICEECREKQLQEENKQAAKQNAAAGLPQLTGSEKQIAWAEKIRADKIKKITDALEGQMDLVNISAYWGDAMAPDDLRTAHAITLLKNQTAASWWIDNRGRKISLILAELYSQQPEQLDEQEKQLQQEAAIESTVRPESPATETVAEIRPLTDKVTVYFPEKIEDFRLIMRKHGFSWSGSYWERQLTARNGSVQDRAAEIGHILLGSGFIVRIYDESIRQDAINGTFCEEQTRWVTVYTRGDNKGRLCIMWSRDEDYYKAAKSLPTAKYVKPYISVAVGQFEEVLDFAEINGFSISDAAQEAIDEARRIKEQSIVASVTIQEQTHRKKPSDRPEKLDVPEHVEVDDDLRDD